MWSRPRSAHPGTSFSRRRRSPRRRHAEAYIDPPAPALYLVTLISAALPCPVFCCVSSSSSSVAACPELPSSLAPERLSVRLCAPTKSTRRMVSAPKNDYEVGKRRSHTELQQVNVRHSVCKLAPEAATLSHVILSDPGRAGPPAPAPCHAMPLVYIYTRYGCARRAAEESARAGLTIRVY